MAVRDPDTVSQVETFGHFIRIFAILMMVVLGVFVYWVTLGSGTEYSTGTLYLVLLAGLAGAGIISFFAAYLAQRAVLGATGGMVNILMGLRSWRDFGEQVAGDLNRVRYFIRSGHYDEALPILDDILGREPDFTEALALKAQVLWAGYGNKAESWRLLRKILKETPKSDPCHRWAAEYYQLVSSARPGETGQGSPGPDVPEPE